MWKLWDCKLLLFQNVVGCIDSMLRVQVFKGLCQDTGRELAVKIVRDLNEKVDA